MKRASLGCTLFILLSLFLLPSLVCGQTQIEHSLQHAKGMIQRIYFKSDNIGERNVDIWLPEKYSSDQKYSVLYMHDGQMLFDATSSWNKKSWMVDSTIQQLIDDNKIARTIVVGIWNSGNNRHAEYFPQKAIDYIPENEKGKLLQYMPSGPLADRYLKFIVEELKPFIDSAYSVHTDLTHTNIAGSSMGGLISLYAICEYPQIFGGAGCISSHWIGTLEKNIEIPSAINTYLNTALPSPQNHKIYFDYGTVGLDANYPEFQQIINETLRQNNYDERSTISLRFTGDDHNEDCWAARFFHVVEFLLTR